MAQKDKELTDFKISHQKNEEKLKKLQIQNKLLQTEKDNLFNENA